MICVYWYIQTDNAIITPVHLFPKIKIITAMSANRTTYRKWLEIQDLVGAASNWPRSVRLYMRTKNLHHWGRVMLVAFAWVNGLHQDVLFEWLEL